MVFISIILGSVFLIAMLLATLDTIIVGFYAYEHGPLLRHSN